MSISISKVGRSHKRDASRGPVRRGCLGEHSRPRALGEKVLRERCLVLLGCLCLLLAIPGAAFAAPVVDGPTRGTFLYNLADFDGPVPADWANVFVDPSHHEIYVTSVSTRTVRIFNEYGMQVHSFGEDEQFGAIRDGAVHPNGDIFLLSMHKRTATVVRCDYRGEPLETIAIDDLPEDFADLSLDRMAYRAGLLYLADRQHMKVVVVDEAGKFRRGIDLAKLMEMSEERGADDDSGITGFSVDRAGNIYFTVQSNFAAYRLDANGRLDGFGKPGSSPGKFGVVGGVVSDDRGNILVADILRSVVGVFGEDFRFKSEFGYRGRRPENLVAPKEIAFDRDRVFVSQRGGRGISVFQMTYGSPTQPNETETRKEREATKRGSGASRLEGNLEKQVEFRK